MAKSQIHSTPQNQKSPVRNGESPNRFFALQTQRYLAQKLTKARYDQENGIYTICIHIRK